ncbi:MAG: T9SS type A sorting domain-containing protein [Bacteroidetes bacterium]|nr:T9SS type A sorting domain-containing protein [Bacteroidota bacterium]
MKTFITLNLGMLLMSAGLNAQYFQHAYGSACEAMGDGTVAVSGPMGHIFTGHTDLYSGQDIQLVRTNTAGQISGMPFFNEVFRINGSSGTLYATPVKVLNTPTNEILVVSNTNNSFSTSPEFAVTKFTGTGAISWSSGFSDPAWNNATATSACLSNLYPNNIYVCGYVTTTSASLVVMPFILCIDWVNNTVLWSQTYDIRPLAADDNRPADIISPLSGNRLIMVGTSDNAGAIDGFFMEVDYNNGVPIQRSNPLGIGYEVMLYDNAGGIDIVTGIATRLTNTGSPFHIICGNSDFGSAIPNLRPWLFQINDMGVVQWSKELTYSVSSSFATVNDIIARVNTMGQHEYYLTGMVDVGYTYFNGDPVVFKCDNNGNPVDEFNFPMPGSATQNQWGVSLGIETSSGIEGLAIYCNDGAGFLTGAAGDMYVVKSYFNGVNGCNEVLTTFTSSNAPTNNFDYNVSTINSLTTTNISVVPLGSSGDTPNCNASSLANGSNVRLVNNGDQENGAELLLTPNPALSATQMLYLNTNYTGEKQTLICIINAEGREVQRQVLTIAGGEQRNCIKINEQLAAGIYLIRIQHGNSAETLKLIIE